MKSISPAEREVATRFMYDILMGSESVVPRKQDTGNLIIIPAPNSGLPFSEMEIILHTSQIPLSEFIRREEENQRRGCQIIHVFYSDNVTFNVRPDNEKREKLSKGILKKHSNEIKGLFVPRLVEKRVLEITGELIYYVPNRNPANDSIRVVTARPAMLDHSHILPEVRKPYEIDGPSKKYWIKELKAVIRYGDRMDFEKDKINSAAYNLQHLPGDGTPGPAQGSLF